MEELGGEGRRGRGRGGGAIQCLASGRHRLSCATGDYDNERSVIFNKQMVGG